MFQALLRRAAGLIGERIGRIVRSSACYESAPWGFRAEQSFWNQVLEVETPLHPEELLEAVLSVEAELGRDRVQEGLEKAARIVLCLLETGRLSAEAKWAVNLEGDLPWLFW